MEQAAAQYLMVMKRKQDIVRNKVCHFQTSWEERAFAEDHAALTWPPRSYSCSFCNREFRSAQALGGHMNVHRRDRARLKQSLTHEVLRVPDSARRGHDHDLDHDNGMGTDLCVGLICPSQTLTIGCKRPKLAVSSLQFSLKPCFHAADVNVVAFKASSMEDLDLELRLGHDPPQVK